MSFVSSSVELLRGSLVESRHIVHIAVADARGGLRAWSGNRELVAFVRSSIKMFQALPLVEDSAAQALGLTPEELALCTASHSGEPRHVEIARSILRKASAGEDALACGAHEPLHALSAQALERAGTPPGRIHNNCSGKHAGMLALARHHGWPFEGYHRLEHPVQQRVIETLARWTGLAVENIPVAVDGCGVPTFAVPLDRAARACAAFAAAAREQTPAQTIVDAMTSHPEMVAGTGRLCTALMRATAGRLFAKVGAEGYYLCGVPEEGIGLALKVEDGARRAAEPALLAALHSLDLVAPQELDALAAFARPAVRNTRGELVGELRARIVWSTGD